MRLILEPGDLSLYVANQVSNFFPDISVGGREFSSFIDRTLERLDFCFSRIHIKYYAEDGAAVFNHLNTNHYASFLYFLSNTIYRETGDPTLAEKVFALNKALHGLDLFYEVEMPDVFMLVHPVGAVLGRAKYGNYLCVYQGCSVGADLDGVYPTLGEGVVLFGGSRVIGDSLLGDNCWIAPNAVVMDTEVPKDSIVFGLPPDTATKPARHRVLERIFGITETEPPTEGEEIA